jgi:hypothetical protein
MPRTPGITSTDAGHNGSFETAFTSLSTSPDAISSCAPTGVTVTLDEAMPLTVMLAVEETAGMPFFITVSTATSRITPVQALL